MDLNPTIKRAESKISAQGRRLRFLEACGRSKEACLEGNAERAISFASLAAYEKTMEGDAKLAAKLAANLDSARGLEERTDVKSPVLSWLLKRLLDEDVEAAASFVSANEFPACHTILSEAMSLLLENEKYKDYESLFGAFIRKGISLLELEGSLLLKISNSGRRKMALAIARKLDCMHRKFPSSEGFSTASARLFNGLVSEKKYSPAIKVVQRNLCPSLQGKTLKEQMYYLIEKGEYSFVRPYYLALSRNNSNVRFEVAKKIDGIIFNGEYEAAYHLTKDLVGGACSLENRARILGWMIYNLDFSSVERVRKELGLESIENFGLAMKHAYYLAMEHVWDRYEPRLMEFLNHKPPIPERARKICAKYGYDELVKEVYNSTKPMHPEELMWREGFW